MLNGNKAKSNAARHSSASLYDPLVRITRGIRSVKRTKAERQEAQRQVREAYHAG